MADSNDVPQQCCPSSVPQSHVIPQRKLLRMRVQIDLVSQVLDVQNSNIVTQQRQRNEAGMIIFNAGQQLVTRRIIEIVSEEAFQLSCKPNARVVRLVVGRGRAISGQ